MALFDLSKRTKEIIVAVLTVISFAFLQFATLFGWNLEPYQAIISVVVILLEVIFGIVWVNYPKKPSNDTGGSG